MKKSLHEKKKKKEYTYKNGLSITPFLKIKDDAGDVETGIENFNKNMSTGNLQAATQGNTNSNVSMGLAEAVSASTVAINDAVNDLLNINGPQYRGAPYPPFDEFAINESEIPDNMRAKEFSIDNINTSYGKDEANIDCTWITQESFDDADAEEFIKEFQRAIEAICDKNEVDITTEINIEIICRDGRNYGHHLDTIIYNGKKFVNNSINEDNTRFSNNIKNIKSDYIKKENKMTEGLKNIVDVEEKSREVVDPGFAAAVRSIKENDKKRDKANILRKAPKQGEESLPKDTKITLDESLFIETINSTNSNIEEIDINTDVLYGEDLAEDIKDTIRRYFTGNISTFIDTLLEEASMIGVFDEMLDVLDTIKEKIKLGD